jgi:hypothetical protein
MAGASTRPISSTAISAPLGADTEINGALYFPKVELSSRNVCFPNPPPSANAKGGKRAVVSAVALFVYRAVWPLDIATAGGEHEG